jgi:predicted nucleic acid-binding protein
VKVVFNSSPIIVLGKLGYLEKAVELFGEAFIPKAVADEINAREDDVNSLLSQLIREDKISLETAGDTSQFEYPGLHGGEIEVIGMAKRLNEVAILDDLKARKAARLEGLRVMGTVAVLRLLRDAGHLTETNEELLRSLLGVGFRIRPELFYKIMGDER